jgi:hypothetical protein
MKRAAIVINPSFLKINVMGIDDGLSVCAYAFPLRTGIATAARWRLLAL